MPPAAPSSATLRAPAFASVMTALRLLMATRLHDMDCRKDAVLGMPLRMPSKVASACLTAGICLEWAATGACLQDAACMLIFPARTCILLLNLHTPDTNYAFFWKVCALNSLGLAEGFGKESEVQLPFLGLLLHG